MMIHFVVENRNCCLVAAEDTPLSLPLRQPRSFTTDHHPRPEGNLRIGVLTAGSTRRTLGKRSRTART